MRLNVDGEIVEVEINRVINAGYSGRDQEAVQEHIDELVAEGVEAPDEVPMTFELAPYATVVDPGEITVVGEHTSGEAEFGLIVTSDETYVVAASDQTDRKLESQGIQLSKQISPNVISSQAWRLEDVRDQWDDISITATSISDEEHELYQDATLGDILLPEELIEICECRYSGSLAGSVILSGTVPTVSGELSPSERFEVVLSSPADGRKLTLGYDINVVCD